MSPPLPQAAADDLAEIAAWQGQDVAAPDVLRELLQLRVARP
ncbi:MAG: hypothetical protein ACR2GH_17485 [Pseudonocardia sp.]